MNSLEVLLTEYGWKVSGLFMLGILLTPLLIILWAMGQTWDATFSAHARTEVVSFESGEQNIPNWFLAFDRLEIDGIEVDPVRAQLNIAQNTRITLRRFGSGPIELRIEATGAGPVAQLFDLAERSLHQVDDRLQALIEVQPDAAVTLPLAGGAIIGETIFSQTATTSPVLLEGEIETFGIEFRGDNRFSANKTQLSPGDRLEIGLGDHTAGGYGLIRAGSGSHGMQVVFHADGDSAQIVRFGTAGYELRPSIWSWISADPLFRNLLTIYAALLPIIAVAGSSILTHCRINQFLQTRANHTKNGEASGEDVRLDTDTTNQNLSEPKISSEKNSDWQ